MSFWITPDVSLLQFVRRTGQSPAHLVSFVWCKLYSITISQSTSLHQATNVTTLFPRWRDVMLSQNVVLCEIVMDQSSNQIRPWGVLVTALFFLDLHDAICGSFSTPLCSAGLQSRVSWLFCNLQYLVQTRKEQQATNQLSCRSIREHKRKP